MMRTIKHGWANRLMHSPPMPFERQKLSSIKKWQSLKPFKEVHETVDDPNGELDANRLDWSTLGVGLHIF